MSLHGLRVLNTRPLSQGLALNEAINAAGGVAVSFPTLEIQPTPIKSWISEKPDLNSINQAIFISTNAVHYFFKAFLPHKWPTNLPVLAIGSATQQALATYNLPARLHSQQEDSEHLLLLDCLQQIKSQTILLIKGSGGRQLIEQSLSARGAVVISLNVYERHLPSINYNLAYTLWKDNAIDIILITSEQSMHNLFHLFKINAFEKQTKEWLLQKTFLVISHRLATVAQKLGIQNIIISSPTRILPTLKEFAHDNRKHTP